MANRDYIVFDFETGSRNPNKTQPTQIAAIALDGRNLAVKGTFNSEIKAILDDDKAIAEGLDPIGTCIKSHWKNKINWKNYLKSVWNKFTKFVDNTTGKAKILCSIPVGYNIIGFDMIINRLCQQFGQWDSTRQQQKLFSKVYKVDLMDNMFMWTEGDPSVKSISMDTLRDRMGLSTENAHDALQDVKDTANIFIKLLKTHRSVYQNIELDKAFANGKLYVK